MNYLPVKAPKEEFLSYGITHLEYFLINQDKEYLAANTTKTVNVFTIIAEVNIMVMKSQQQQEVPLLRNIIKSLLKNRDFLGYQLSFHKGNLTEDQFDIIKDKYLKPPDNTWNTETLAYNALALMKNTSLVFDADEISTMFDCEIDVAENVLSLIIERLNNG